MPPATERPTIVPVLTPPPLGAGVLVAEEVEDVVLVADPVSESDCVTVAIARDVEGLPERVFDGGAEEEIEVVEDDGAAVDEVDVVEAAEVDELVVVVVVVVVVEAVDNVVEYVVLSRLVVEVVVVVADEVSPGSKKSRPSCAYAFLRCCGSGGERRGCG